MSVRKSKHSKVKLHPRNKHNERYDFKKLIISCPELEQFVGVNKYGNESIDFFNAHAVKTLNKALLLHHYNLSYWDIPKNYLCPPIPGRADYVHYLADLLACSNDNEIPKGKRINCLDIGTGANCIYPIIGHHEYGWSFVASDIDPKAIASADKIRSSNKSLVDAIQCRQQENTAHIFKGIIMPNERYDISMCNPPFHSSQAEAQAGSLRKLKNLKKKNVSKVSLNFGGQSNELWTPGGEKQFILHMIHESGSFAKSVCWFSSLVSKEENLQSIYKALDQAGATAYETFDMQQGNKSSRMVAWTFLSKAKEQKWAKSRWHSRLRKNYKSSFYCQSLAWCLISASLWVFS